MSRSFLHADIPLLVKKLTLDEKIALLGAPNWWNTTSVQRLDIPAVRMSDGPNGVRGSSHLASTPAQCLPCGTSLASTFDLDLLHQVGAFLAQEAKVKSSVILLAPTCNIQRSPLGGRVFECFSEDPYLSGLMASAYVNGLQAEGVSATIKHFVGNDQEHERTAAESVMSDRALREVYLYPFVVIRFMLAQRLAKPWAFMTSYGRIQGIHCSENPRLLQGILRQEWNFKGIIISDWFGTYGVDEPINAGLDLEMPGPPRWRTPLLVHHCLTAQKILPLTIDERVTTILAFAQKLARLNPEVVYGDGNERTRDSPLIRKFCRQVAAEGIVLLKNTNSVLPLKPGGNHKVAVIGPNAKQRIISGGGSAALKASYVITPLQGIQEGAPQDIHVSHEIGCYAHKYLPTLEKYLVTPSGESGWLCTFYSHDENGELIGPIAELVLEDTRVKLNDYLPAGLTKTWTIKLTGKLTVDRTAPFELGLTVAGRAKLWIDRKLTIDNWTKQTPGDFFYGQGTVEEKATIDMVSGKSVDVLVEYINTSPQNDSSGGDTSAQPALMRGVRLGGCEKIDPEKAIKDAVTLAAHSDVVVFVGGLSPEWESEGFDRPSLQLPGRQDEVISKLAAANPNTVVCLQAGSAVSMPWIDEIAGLFQTWYLGNEAGNAIADVIFGKVNPGGRLPLTFPQRIEDIPAFPNLRSENGKIYYHEDVFVGYKQYLARGIRPLFCFGYGLSYTKFSLSDLTIKRDDTDAEICVTVKNDGAVGGSEVVQLYISYPDKGATHPPLQMKGFAKARDIAPGDSHTVTMKLDKYAFSFWDTRSNAWRIDSGIYSIQVGFNCEDIVLQGTIEIERSITWIGL